MKFRASPVMWPLGPTLRRPHRLPTVAFSRSFSSAGSNGGGSFFIVPGATVATILMLGALHARRLYSDRKVEEAREKGIELQFSPDAKASFLRMLPLRSISRLWGFMASLDLPVWLRRHVYKAWARAFDANLEEAAMPLEEYTSLREFFVRRLKEGSRPIDSDPCSLVSPVDGVIVRIGELRDSRGMIEQVKGFSYRPASLLGEKTLLPMAMEEDMINEEGDEVKILSNKSGRKSWWRIAFASPKVQGSIQTRPKRGIFYCVLYLGPGSYHRVHSPVDWQVFLRRHFAGRLYPLNERATRTIRNLHVENERVVLEGEWEGGFMAMAAIGATLVGSIELAIEPELKTNRPKKGFQPSNPPDERIYEPHGIGVTLKKADEVAAFNLGSTVVLIFQAPKSNDRGSNFTFCVKRGERVRMGEALGRWHS